MTDAPIKLHQFPRSLGVPCPSPFCVKLELWLRIAGIPYENVDDTMPMKAPKGKIPWIEDGGQRLGDSQLIIEHLKRTRGVDPDAGLSETEKARDAAFQAFLEDRFYWLVAYERWMGPGWPVIGPAFFDTLPWPLRPVMMAVARRMMRRQFHAQGTGRHTPDEVEAMGLDAVRQLGDLIGDGPYVHGETIRAIDAIAYASVVNVTAIRLDTPLVRAARADARLTGYGERISREYFADVMGA